MATVEPQRFSQDDRSEAGLRALAQKMDAENGAFEHHCMLLPGGEVRISATLRNKEALVKMGQEAVRNDRAATSLAGREVNDV